MANAKSNEMQVDMARCTDPLVTSDPWASTPRPGTRPAEGSPQQWLGWPADADLLQMDIPQFPVPAKAQCVSHSVPGSTASSRSTSLASHRGEGSVGSSEGQKRKHSEPPHLSKEDLVSTMGEFQCTVMQQIKQQSDLLLFQIGK
eukprot:11917839-Karenia_brevis.AAC.1